MMLTCCRTSGTFGVASETNGQSSTRKKSLANSFTLHDLSGQPRTTGLTLSHPRDRNGGTIPEADSKSYLTVYLAYSSNRVRPAMATKIQGIEGMKHGELEFELQRGAKFVLFQYCVSVIVLTFRRPSDIYFVRQGENAVVKGLPFTLLSLVAGWWGIPWGPIYTIQSIYNNLQGGKDVTPQVRNTMRAPAPASAPSLA